MPHQFILNDVLIALDDLAKATTSVQMAFFDPPYNIGFKYSDKVDGNLPPEASKRILKTT